MVKVAVVVEVVEGRPRGYPPTNLSFALAVRTPCN